MRPSRAGPATVRGDERLAGAWFFQPVADALDGSRGGARDAEPDSVHVLALLVAFADLDKIPDMIGNGDIASGPEALA